MAEELSGMDLSEAERLKAAYEEARQRAEEAARACSETTKEQARAESALDQAERALPLLARAEEESGQAVRAWRDAYPELSEAAEARLAALMQEAHGERSMEERLQSYESSRRGNETRRDNMWQQLLVARERYGLEHGDTGHMTPIMPTTHRSTHALQRRIFPPSRRRRARLWHSRRWSSRRISSSACARRSRARGMNSAT